MTLSQLKRKYFVEGFKLGRRRALNETSTPEKDFIHINLLDKEWTLEDWVEQWVRQIDEYVHQLVDQYGIKAQKIKVYTYKVKRAPVICATIYSKKRFPEDIKDELVDYVIEITNDYNVKASQKRTFDRDKVLHVAVNLKDQLQDF